MEQPWCEHVTNEAADLLGGRCGNCGLGADSAGEAHGHGSTPAPHATGSVPWPPVGLCPNDNSAGGLMFEQQLLRMVATDAAAVAAACAAAAAPATARAAAAAAAADAPDPPSRANSCAIPSPRPSHVQRWMVPYLHNRLANSVHRLDNGHDDDGRRSRRRDDSPSRSRSRGRSRGWPIAPAPAPTSAPAPGPAPRSGSCATLFPPFRANSAQTPAAAGTVAVVVTAAVTVAVTAAEADGA